MTAMQVGTLKNTHLDNDQTGTYQSQILDETTVTRELSPPSLIAHTALDRLQQGNITATELLSLLTNYRLLPQLVRELLIDQTIAPITYTPEEMIDACKQFYEQNQIASDEQRQAWLSRNHLTLEQLDALITRNLKIEKFKQITWGAKLESYFLQRKAQLDRVIYSLIRTKDMVLLQELYFRIQAGEQSFAELAREYSQGSEAQTGGLVGPTELTMPHPALAQALMNSQPGQLLQPARMGNWFVIARLEKLMPAQLDEPMRQRLLNELYEQWLNGKMQEIISQ